MATFHAPIAIARVTGDSRALLRRLFMEAVGGADPCDCEISDALYATATLSGVPLIRVVDELIELGLRAPMEAFPKPWVAVMRGRVLDTAERELLSYAQRIVAAQWAWLPVPQAKTRLPVEIDAELDPYGADLMSIFMVDLGDQPRFGYTPAQIRLALLRTAVGLGRPLAEVVTALVERGMVMPAEAVPAACREAIKFAPQSPLVHELVGSWQASREAMAEVIPLRQAR